MINEDSNNSPLYSSKISPNQFLLGYDDGLVSVRSHSIGYRALTDHIIAHSDNRPSDILLFHDPITLSDRVAPLKILDNNQDIIAESATYPIEKIKKPTRAYAFFNLLFSLMLLAYLVNFSLFENHQNLLLKIIFCLWLLIVAFAIIQDKRQNTLEIEFTYSGIFQLKSKGFAQYCPHFHFLQLPAGVNILLLPIMILILTDINSPNQYITYTSFLKNLILSLYIFLIIVFLTTLFSLDVVMKYFKSRHEKNCGELVSLEMFVNYMNPIIVLQREEQVHQQRKIITSPDWTRTGRDSKETLRIIIDEIETHSSAGKNDWTEEETKGFITRIFEHVLGWSPMSPPEVTMERTDSKGKRTDYRFQNKSSFLFVIEAKPWSKNLDSFSGKPNGKGPYQARNYAHELGASIAILTNLKEFIFYDCSDEKTIPEKTDPIKIGQLRHGSSKTRMRINLTQLLEEPYFEFLMQFHRDKTTDGSIRELCKNSDLSPKINKIGTYMVNKIQDWRILIAKQISIGNTNSKGKIKLTKDNQLELEELTMKLICSILLIRSFEDLKPVNLKHLMKDKGLQWALKNHQESLGETWKVSLIEYLESSILNKTLEKIWDKIKDDLYDEDTNSKYVDFTRVSHQFRALCFEEVSKKTLQITPRRRYPKVDLKDVSQEQKYGSFATPMDIAEVMVNEAITNQIKKGKSARDLTLIDISCGSGTFIIQGFQQIKNKLLEEAEESGERELLDNLETGHSYADFLKIDECKRIMTECINGREINVPSQIFTQYCLCLEFLEEFRFRTAFIPPLPNLTDNIKHGNSLVEISDSCINTWEDSETGIPPVEEYERYDIVIGNPPYIANTPINKMPPDSLLPIQKEYLREKWHPDDNTTHKQDVCCFFMMQAMEIVNDNGVVALMQTPSVFSQDYGVYVRNKIRPHMSSFIRLSGFGDSDSSSEALVPVISLGVDTQDFSLFDFSQRTRRKSESIKISKPEENKLWLLGSMKDTTHDQLKLVQRLLRLEADKLSSLENLVIDSVGATQNYNFVKGKGASSRLRDNWQQDRLAAKEAVACPKCEAVAGQQCTTEISGNMAPTHKARVFAYYDDTMKHIVYKEGNIGKWIIPKSDSRTWISASDVRYYIDNWEDNNWQSGYSTEDLEGLPERKERYREMTTGDKLVISGTEGYAAVCKEKHAFLLRPLAFAYSLDDDALHLHKLCALLNSTIGEAWCKSKPISLQSRNFGTDLGVDHLRSMPIPDWNEDKLIDAGELSMKIHSSRTLNQTKNIAKKRIDKLIQELYDDLME